MGHPRLSIALVSATVLTVRAPGALAQSDPFYDNSPFPQRASQLFSIQAQSEQNEAICKPVSYSTPRSYELVNEPGPNCSYQSWTAAFLTSPIQFDGINECKSRCDDYPQCRSFAWSLSLSKPDEGECFLDNNFCDLFAIECNVDANPNMYLGVYNVTSWTPPDPLVENGDFETGCLESWFFSDFSSDESMTPTIIDCAAVAGDCAPNGGGNYIKITGNGQNGSTRDHIDAYIGQKPALEEGVDYRVSASVRGTGEFRFTYPVHDAVKIRVGANITQGWREVSGILTGRNVGTFLIQMDAPAAAAEFGIDNVKIEKI